MVDEALGMFERSGNVEVKKYEDTVVYQVVASERAAMDYYKNTIMHAFAQEGLLATTLLHARNADGSVVRGSVETDCAILSRMLKYEFVYSSGKSFSESFDDTWRQFESMGWLREDGDEVFVPASKEPLLRFLKHGVLPFIEAYHLACTYTQKLDEPEPERDFQLSIVAEGQKLFEVGELQLREACSTATVRNAMRVLRELGVIKTHYEGRKAMVSLADGQAKPILEDFATQLKGWCSVPQ
jgi:glycerol-3-phosphate O-acyltransferase